MKYFAATIFLLTSGCMTHKSRDFVNKSVDVSKVNQLTRVQIETELGPIDVELENIKAPNTVGHFLKMVDSGLYKNAVFHRTVTLSNQPDNKVKIEVIQGGPAVQPEVIETVKLERTSVTKIKHLNGTLSMARNEPDTANTNFFICINDQPELDFGGARNPDGQGFAAFGHVIRGMDIVKSIQTSKSAGQKLTPAIKIIKINRLDKN